MTRTVAAVTASLPFKGKHLTVMITARIHCNHDNKYYYGDEYKDDLSG